MRDRIDRIVVVGGSIAAVESATTLRRLGYAGQLTMISAEHPPPDGVITGAAVAIAETGAIVLDGSPGQGRRAITLVPDYHLCIVRADQVVETVPEAVARLADRAGRPLTGSAGRRPPATSS